MELLGLLPSFSNQTPNARDLRKRVRLWGLSFIVKRKKVQTVI